MQNAEKYKKYVEEHKYIFNNKKQFSYNNDYSLIYPKLSYSQTSNAYTFATMPKLNSMYVKNSNYFTEKPTEHPREEPTEEPTEKIEYIVTNNPTKFITKCPSVLNSTTPIPTINLKITNYKSDVENNNNTIIIIFSILSFVLFFISIYFYKYYYLKYKKLKDNYKKNERDLDFGLSYVDDF